MRKNWTSLRKRDKLEASRYWSRLTRLGEWNLCAWAIYPESKNLSAIFVETEQETAIECADRHSFFLKFVSNFFRHPALILDDNDSLLRTRSLDRFDTINLATLWYHWIHWQFQYELIQWKGDWMDVEQCTIGPFGWKSSSQQSGEQVHPVTKKLLQPDQAVKSLISTRKMQRTAMRDMGLQMKFVLDLKGGRFKLLMVLTRKSRRLCPR